MDESKKSRSTSRSALACPSCGRAADAGERFCASCGMPLVHAGDESAEEPRSSAHERARKIRPELTRGPLRRIAGGRNQAEAELIQNVLLEEGVPSVLRRSAGFDVPDFLAAGPRDVLVPESGVEVARAAVSAEGIAPAPLSSGAGPTRTQVLGIAAAIALAAALTALIAWALVQAGS
jgi:hypothetical protein